VIFQDGGRRHLGFSKIRNINRLFPVGANVHHHAKLLQNQSNGCGDMPI